MNLMNSSKLNLPSLSKSAFKNNSSKSLSGIFYYPNFTKPNYISAFDK